ncbi:MAG: hypothetical protein JW963_08965 [Anaerolineales bacterium]|nr:hypothetical protein [Anaerolineales bacterium]
MGTSVSRDAQLSRLAADVCLTALEEAKSNDPIAALDAIFWLTGDDFPLWAEWAGIPFADARALITSGRARRVRIRRKDRENE